MSQAGAVVIVAQAADDERRIERLIALSPIVLILATVEDARLLLGSSIPPMHDRQSDPDERRSDDLVVNLEEHVVRWGQQDLPLTEQEFRMMAALGREFGHSRSFSELAELTGTPYRGDADRIRSAVKRLRRKLAAAGAHVDILSVPGYGFRLSKVRRSQATTVRTPEGV
jgi:DNA-binding response OmpR family regulator